MVPTNPMVLTKVNEQSQSINQVTGPMMKMFILNSSAQQECNETQD